MVSKDFYGLWITKDVKMSIGSLDYFFLTGSIESTDFDS